MRMYSKNIRLALGIWVLVRIPMSINAQDAESQLVLADLGLKIENQIQLNVSKSDYNKIKTSKGEKISLKNPTAKINGDSVFVKDIHLRGQTTLYLRRKSYAIKTVENMSFFHEGKIKQMKQVDAVSLSMDKNYVRNRLSFQLMEHLQLFELYNSFSELKINGNTEGIYLVLEPPIVWALNEQHSPLVLRRGYNHIIEKIKAGKETGKTDEKSYRDHYTKIYQSLDKFEGQKLYDQLNQYIDLGMYMKWLAFNYFVRNGDYSDEVFLYIDPEDDRFRVIPWDYDDIFASAPHEGTGQARQIIGEKMIFSSEDELESKIANDPYLYSRYLIHFNEVLSALTETKMKEVLEKTYAELYPYFSDAEIIGMSQYDTHKECSTANLFSDLNFIYTNLILTRQTLIKKIDKMDL